MSAPRDLQRAWVLRLLQRELGGGDAPWGDLALPDFQQRAVVALRAALACFGGALLADEVGLGKTHVALALLAEHPRGAVFAPAILLPMWRRALEAAGLSERVHLASHTALSRAASPDEALPAPAGLLVVDEAHAFAHPGTLRYRTLALLAAEHPTLLLTATPVGLAPRDLVALLRLFCPRGALAPLLGAPLEEAVAQGADLTPALRRLMVRRPRALLRRLYPRGVRVPTASGELARLDFPLRQQVLLQGDLSARWPGLLDALLAEIEALDEQVVQAPAPLLRALLLARLESSPAALDASLSRLEAFLRRSLEAARLGAALDRRAWRALFGQLAAEDDRQLLLPFAWAERAAPGAPGPDRLCAQLERVLRLRELLRPLLAEPPLDAPLLALLQSLPEDAPALLFTRFTDTAAHLLRVVSAAFPGSAVGLLHGGGACVAGGGGAPQDLPRDLLLDRFAHPQEDPRAAIRVLIATDVLAEGANLQRCRLVASLDMPWNPRRLVQRFGRVDRLGPPGRQVTLALALPDRSLERLLELQRRVSERLDAASKLLQDDPDPLLPHPDHLRWLQRLLHAGEDPLDAALAALHPAATAAADPEHDLLALLRSPPPDAPLPPGWCLQATPRFSPGTLLLLAVEGDLEPVRYAFVEASSLRVEARREQVYPRLHALLRRVAAPAERPPPMHLRAGLTWALRLAQGLRAAPAPALPPASAANRLLRRLAAAPPPSAHDPDALAWHERLMDALRAPLPTAAALEIQRVLDAEGPLSQAVEAALYHAPPPALPPGDPAVHLLGFVLFTPAPEK